ncbi:hypothetical protein BAE44_0025953 [Dichanthelium oligosanthes]|uniref:Uncharacterized protein n=1 Tax=Dichanthelium oligosanthes TaxID=888268 RepID=A0A1E5UJI2_9POAL|nr:hypothetical protein BAE44_0025953 [Dichanthelium oligosanthes]
MDKTTDDLARISKKSKRTDDLERSSKKNHLVLVNTFGDVYGGGVCSELSETVSSNVSQNVVSLASFYGNFTLMCYLCTTLSYLYFFHHS